MADEINEVVLTEEQEREINIASGWTKGEDIVPSVYYQKVAADSWCDDESIAWVWVEDAELSEADVIALKEKYDPEHQYDEYDEYDDIEQAEVLGRNLFGRLTPGRIAYVHIDPSADLEEAYPEVHVIIDGKEYNGLSVLANPVEFNLDKDHRIVIDWDHGNVYESFRLVINR